MHEASLAQGLLKITLDSVRSYNAEHPEAPAGRITALRLGLGLLSCVEATTFTGCFELLAEGSEAEGARLDIVREPLDCTCEDCGARFSLSRRHFVCPSCHGTHLSFSGGHGLTLLSMEVEKMPPDTDGHTQDTTDFRQI